jgi:hypothetical protein
VAKHETLPYEEGARRMLLGLDDDDGDLCHVGIASSFSRRVQHELLDVLRPLVVPLAGHPWERGFLLAGGATGRLRGSAGRWSPT